VKIFFLYLETCDYADESKLWYPLQNRRDVWTDLQFTQALFSVKYRLTTERLRNHLYHLCIGEKISSNGVLRDLKTGVRLLQVAKTINLIKSDVEKNAAFLEFSDVRLIVSIFVVVSYQSHCLRDDEQKRRCKNSPQLLTLQWLKSFHPDEKVHLKTKIASWSILLFISVPHLIVNV